MKFDIHKILPKKISISWICQVAAATTLLIGAVFMLVNTFTEAEWAFWTGLAFGIIAGGAYVAMVILEKQEVTKKLTEKPTDSSYSDKKDNIVVHEEKQTAKIEVAKDETAKVQTPKPKTRKTETK